MHKFLFLTFFTCLVKLSTAQLLVTTTPMNSSICSGGSIYITASYSPATTDPVEFIWSPATGLNTTSGATVIASPSVTTIYTVTCVNTLTHESGSANITISIDPFSYNLAGTSGGSAVCQITNIGATGTSYRDGNCSLIAAIQPAGLFPVSGSINTCVRIDTGANKMGSLDLYVARRYDIEPASNPSTSSANITLYYLQSEFDNYNRKSQDSGLFNIPTGPGDNAGISNLRIRQFHGTGSVPGSYTGGRQDFNSTNAGVSIIWNASRNWWEITFPVTGFSGFYISSAKGSFATLPVNLIYFKGVKGDKKNLLNWKVSCTSAKTTFEIQRSSTSTGFNTINNLTADKLRCNDPFDFTDVSPLNGKNFYRLKMIDDNGKFEYSNVISISNNTAKFSLAGMYPNIVAGNDAYVNIIASEKNEVHISVNDMAGRNFIQQDVQLHSGSNSIKINTTSFSAGSYLLLVSMEGEEKQVIQFIKK